MNGVAEGEKRRWMIAAAAAGVVVILLAAMFRPPAPPFPLPVVSDAMPVRPAADARPVQLAKPTAAADAVFNDLVALRDLQPLFLPTEHNASPREPRLEPGRTFLENETVKLSFPDADVGVIRELPRVATLNGVPVEKATAIDVLDSNASSVSLQGFGRKPAAIAPVEGRSGFIEVFAMNTGETVLSDVLPAGARPPGDKSWAPLELLAVVDAAGLAAPLVVTEGSRVEEVDAHFRDYLARSFRLGQRLPAGFYRVVVGP